MQPGTRGAGPTHPTPARSLPAPGAECQGNHGVPIAAFFRVDSRRLEMRTLQTPAPNSVPRLLVHHVQERLPGEEALEVPGELLDRALPVARAQPRDVRR